ncbi:MAG: hypothetical protein K6E91_04290 [Butyrivibrio sp.]|nr:hypothetical protein [Butyrivibrio sp.]
MNKMVSKAVAITGAAVFAGALVAGIGAPKQVEAKYINGAAGVANFMNPVWDNGTNVQIFKTDYGYGAWATDSNGNIIGNEPVAKTPYYIPKVGTAKRDTDYGDFVASYEVNVVNTASTFGIPGGNTIQTYYDVADFAQNVTDHYDHFANGLPVWQNAYTSSASLDKNGSNASPYVFAFEFGDYNPNYVEFAGTTWNLNNYNNKDKAFVDNTQIGVWTNTKLPDFGAWGDAVVDWNEDGKIDYYVPEVYANPVFEDANSLAYSWALFGKDAEDVLGHEVTDKIIDQETGKVSTYDYVLPGQIMPSADEDGYYWGDIAGYPSQWTTDGEETIGHVGSFADLFNN